MNTKTIRRVISRLKKSLVPKKPVAQKRLNFKEEKIELRTYLAKRWIKGTGIEIGALQKKFPVPESAKVLYVDRMNVDGLRSHYPELNNQDLINVDIVADGERLETIADESFDFVIASHFFEHCENPLLALKNMLRVIKTGGVILMIIPDKRFTFDKERECTTFEHLVADYENGVETSRRAHYEDWAIHIKKRTTKEEIEDYVATRMPKLYSIHFHVWDATSFLGFLNRVGLYLSQKFDLVFFSESHDEVVCLLRKTTVKTSV